MPDTPAPPVAASPPLVSLVVPTHNGAAYLAECLESCLAQDWPALEVIVVDDASRDGSAAIAAAAAARDPRLRLLRRSRQGGTARAFNDGYAAARGVFHTRLAQDDALEPGAVTALARFLGAHPAAGLVYGDTWLVDAGGARLGRHETPAPHEALRGGRGVGLYVMWRGDVWRDLGGFDSRYDTAEDLEFVSRVLQRYALARFDGPPGIRVRMHTDSATNRYRARQDVLTARVLARLQPDAGAARRQVAAGYRQAAYQAYRAGAPLAAAGYLARAVLLQPGDAALWRSLARRLRGRGDAVPPSPAGEPPRPPPPSP